MAKEYKLKIIKDEKETEDIKKILVEKPEGFSFIPGHSVMISLPEAPNEKRPFTITSTNHDDFIEFMIKKYPGGMSEKLFYLKEGNEIILSDIFGSMRYNGKGIFIAGGSGITAFISIFRHLQMEKGNEGNFLIFSCKKASEILRENELREIFGKNVIFTLTREKKEGYECGRVDESFLRKHIKDFGLKIYVCGPGNFSEDITNCFNACLALDDKKKAQDI
ncbi:MAG: FAD-binding oxidoreductase [Nanoarchaeota archaeon]